MHASASFSLNSIGCLRETPKWHLMSRKVRLFVSTRSHLKYWISCTL
jgi:hypothetical protein